MASASSEGQEAEQSVVCVDCRQAAPPRDCTSYARLGVYYKAPDHPTSGLCRAYTKPPSAGFGEYITTIEPGTTIGPVERYDVSGPFLAVLVRNYWINVKGYGVDYAYKVPDSTVQAWYSDGWRD